MHQKKLLQNFYDRSTNQHDSCKRRTPWSCINNPHYVYITFSIRCSYWRTCKVYKGSIHHSLGTCRSSCRCLWGSTRWRCDYARTHSCFTLATAIVSSRFAPRYCVTSEKSRTRGHFGNSRRARFNGACGSGCSTVSWGQRMDTSAAIRRNARTNRPNFRFSYVEKCQSTQ